MSTNAADKADAASQHKPSGPVRQTAIASTQITKRQKGYLDRLLRERGLNPTEAEVCLCQAVNVDSAAELTKRQASALIECLFWMTDPVSVRPESGVPHD